MCDPTCRKRIVKKSKLFWSYVRYFWIAAGVRTCRIFIGVCKHVFMNHAMVFLDWGNKTKIVSVSFSRSESIIVLTDIVSFIKISNKTSLLGCFVYIALAKNYWEIKSGQFKNYQ